MLLSQAQRVWLPPAGTTLFPNIANLPNVSPPPTSPTPPIGSMVYDNVSGCVSVFNGISWNCLSQVSSITVSTLPYTLGSFNNYIQYAGTTAGTMTIPAASTCPNREYYIINGNGGIITLNLPYLANGVSLTTIAINTTVHLVAINGAWYKVN
jgi:hypothetical protein